MNSILEFIGGLIKPITDMVDNLTTTDEERGELKNKLVELQNAIASKVLDYEAKLNEIQGKIVMAEAQGESWLQRNWRPILMISIVAIVVNNYLLFPYLQLFGIKTIELNLPDKLYTLMTVGVGGYVVGRSGEKIIKNMKGK